MRLFRRLFKKFSKNPILETGDIYAYFYPKEIVRKMALQYAKKGKVKGAELNRLFRCNLYRFEFK